MNTLERIAWPGLALALALAAGTGAAEPRSYTAAESFSVVSDRDTAHRGARYRDHERARHRRDHRDFDDGHRHRGHHPLRHDFGRRHWRERRFSGGYWPHYRAHGFRHRYFHGSHYYYNRFGFYFPSYGFIRYGHRHGSHCPNWHFRSFAAGAVLGAVINR